MRNFFLLFLGIYSFFCPLMAQDIYKVEKVSGSDLIGDARYVGMGGAMSALGANLSAMSINPASSALYRSSDFSFTLGSNSIAADKKDADYFNVDKHKMSFDQIGFVYTFQLDDKFAKFINFGFNYKKSRNFMNILAMNDVTLPKMMFNGEMRGLSQSWQMRDLAQIKDRWLDLENSQDRGMTTPLSVLGYNTFVIDPIKGVNNDITDYKPSYAEAYHYGRVQSGGVQQYDFNLSFNMNERFYWGLNLSMYNVNYHSSLEYEEASLGEDGLPFYDINGNRKTYLMKQYETLTGTGVDAKFGIIVRPLAEKPLRLGLSLTTPTFYSLSAHSDLNLRSHHEHKDNKTGQHYDYTLGSVEANNDYVVRTAWKTNFSVGTTFGKVLALGLEYEIADHLSAQVREVNVASAPYYDTRLGEKDIYLQEEIDNRLQDVHTFRMGAEWRMIPNVFLRAGYNWVSPPFASNAYLNLYTDSPSYQYSTSTDYVNLGATHRYTLGWSYRAKGWYFDMSYQHQEQKADVYAFHYNTKERMGEKNDLPAYYLKLKKSNLLFTLGFRF